ncbi:MAG: type II toxin-antitoxin system prevent-host-death family antitoxin [Chthoniobacterales bacterium]|nr:type II toxin-antitoxin system prevent-host-death family antitoxin [Chthoniobacterales bacterium]
MKTISIRQLHEKTGEWVRQAEAHEQIIITERGRPIAALAPYTAPARGNRFRERRLLPAYQKLRGKLSGGTDSSAILSADRDQESAP